MRNLTDFALRLEYERVKDLGDKLVDIGGRLNWEGFRPALEAMYRNNTECGGRPNLDVIVMLKSLIVANDPYIPYVIDFFEYHPFYPFFISARSSIISTYSRTSDLLISSSDAMFSAGIPSP